MKRNHVKLGLTRETLRHLQTSQLAGVAGGTSLFFGLSLLCTITCQPTQACSFPFPFSLGTQCTTGGG